MFFQYFLQYQTPSLCLVHDSEEDRPSLQPRLLWSLRLLRPICQARCWSNLEDNLKWEISTDFIQNSDAEHIRGTECDQKILSRQLSHHQGNTRNILNIQFNNNVSRKESSGQVFSPNYPFPYQVWSDRLTLLTGWLYRVLFKLFRPIFSIKKESMQWLNITYPSTPSRW